MSKSKYYEALYSAKCVSLGLKVFRKHVPYYPGVIANKIDKNFIIDSKKPPLIIGVTGTNGKSTVSYLLCEFFEKMGKKVISNNGYNMDSGVAASLVYNTNILGKVKGDVWIIEIDERESNEIFPRVNFDYLLVTNLFRDSMKRNAHVEFILNLIKQNINKNIRLVLNADDIISSSLDKYNNAAYYSIDRLPSDKDHQDSKICDVHYCPKCGNELIFDYVRYHHIGKLHCEKCDFKNHKSDYEAKVDFKKNIATINKTDYKLLSNSVFNIYNLVSVVALLSEIGYKSDEIKSTLNDMKIDSSRWAETTINNKVLHCILAKGQNSIACSRVFEYVKNEPKDKIVLLMLDDVEDNIEATETVSWIYDADFEYLKDSKIKQIIVGGSRCYDYKLRLMLAGIDEKIIKVTTSEFDMPSLIDFNKADNIYLLFEIFALEQSRTVKASIEKRMSELND